MNEAIYERGQGWILSITVRELVSRVLVTIMPLLVQLILRYGFWAWVHRDLSRELDRGVGKSGYPKRLATVSK
jgi:hypothetical protein